MGKRREAITVLREGLGGHPAYLAWRGMEAGAPRPASIEVLKPEKRRTAVFRLRGCCPGGGDLIAKRRPPGELDGERRLYEQLLPALAVPTAACLGFVEEHEGWAWLFLEDVGEVWYAPDLALHRDLAVRWVAGLHVHDRLAVDWLPETGAAYFRGVVDAADEGLRAALPHPGLSPEGRRVLEAVRRHLARAAHDWEEVELACLEMPSTLTHGDFVAKNVRVRVRGAVPELVAFDWETAGVGPPAVDLAALPGEEAGRRAYLAAVADAWPAVGAADVDRMQALGLLFRLIHSVWWQTRSFRHAWIERAVRHMESYERYLAQALADRGWRMDSAGPE
jgi:aminoglycoside phosphotransferase (APT) family kinase protein